MVVDDLDQVQPMIGPDPLPEGKIEEVERFSKLNLNFLGWLVCMYVCNRLTLPHEH